MEFCEILGDLESLMRFFEILENSRTPEIPEGNSAISFLNTKMHIT
jgi:hypothetical protein